MTQPEGSASVTRRDRALAALHPVLFAAYPVLFLWSQNLDEANLSDVLVSLVVLAGGAAVLTLIVGVLVRDVRRAAIILTPLIIGLLMYGHVARVVRPLHVPGALQQVGWAAIVLGATIVALRLSAPTLQRVGTAMTRIAAVLIVVTLIAIVPAQLTQSAQTANAAPGASGAPGADAAATSAKKRDVYWFIFDRYGSDHSLDLMYGIHTDQTQWLRDQGFTVIDDSHANYVRTNLSLATTNQMRHLPDLPNTPPPSETALGFLTDQIQTSAVAKQFKALGYRYVNIGSWFDPTRTNRLADENLHTGLSEFQSSLFEASALPAVQRRLGMTEPASGRRRHYENNLFGLDAVQKASHEPGPKFVFTHILLPHPPLVFAADGHFLTREELAVLSPKQEFEGQLAYANTRMREVVSTLLDVPEDERPIIIIQGDEGPETDAYFSTRRTTWDWTKASTDDVETKFGILNAWYLPEGAHVGLYPGQTSINTFPLLFRDYFGLDYQLLDDTVYGSRHYGTPYDLVDITDKLAGGD